MVSYNKRLTIKLTTKQFDFIRTIAFNRRLTMSDIVREALSDKYHEIGDENKMKTVNFLNNQRR